MTEKNRILKAIILLLLAIICTSCVHFKRNGLSALITSEYCLYKELVQTYLIVEENISDAIRITNNNSDEAEEYYLIGSIHNDYDSLQFVLYNYYFNNVNSQRCNNKLLVFINKEYYGYYYIGNGEIRFFIKDNELWCAINNTTTCLITIYQNKLNLSDLFIYYNRGDFPTGDSIYFTKYNPNCCEESTPIRYMF